eukprot:1963659-Rhodomonas_salina.1
MLITVPGRCLPLNSSSRYFNNGTAKREPGQFDAYEANPFQPAQSTTLRRIELCASHRTKNEATHRLPEGP